MIHSLVLRIDTRLSRDQKEDAVGRADRQSPFLGDPNANFFCEKALMTENPPVTRRVESTSQSAIFFSDGCRGRGSHAAPSPTTPSWLQMQNIKRRSVTFFNEIFGNISK